MSASVDEQWMRRALELAAHAEAAGEVPVGAILVRDNEILGEGWNCPIGQSDPSAHAEIRALRAAGVATGNYRLIDTTLYVTMEPCAMCAGALVLSRVDRLVFGARDPKAGFCGSLGNLVADSRLNHRLQVSEGVGSEEAARLLRAFFARLRERRTVL